MGKASPIFSHHTDDLSFLKGEIDELRNKLKVLVELSSNIYMHVRNTNDDTTEET
jgi:hypothetical protein